MTHLSIIDSKQAFHLWYQLSLLKNTSLYISIVYWSHCFICVCLTYPISLPKKLIRRIRNRPPLNPVEYNRSKYLVSVSPVWTLTFVLCPDWLKSSLRRVHPLYKRLSQLTEVSLSWQYVWGCCTIYPHTCVEAFSEWWPGLLTREIGLFSHGS